MSKEIEEVRKQIEEKMKEMESKKPRDKWGKEEWKQVNDLRAKITEIKHKTYAIFKNGARADNVGFAYSMSREADFSENLTFPIEVRNKIRSKIKRFARQYVRALLGKAKEKGITNLTVEELSKINRELGSGGKRLERRKQAYELKKRKITEIWGTGLKGQQKLAKLKEKYKDVAK